MVKYSKMFLKRSEIFFILHNLTQLLNFDEVYIMIYQPCRPDMHRGKRYQKSTVLLNYQLHKSKRKNKHNNVNIFYINKEIFSNLKHVTRTSIISIRNYLKLYWNVTVLHNWWYQRSYLSHIHHLFPCIYVLFTYICSWFAKWLLSWYLQAMLSNLPWSHVFVPLIPASFSMSFPI